MIIIPAILLLIGVFFLPDSPRWFAAKRRFHDAERVLLRLRDTSAEAKRELDEIRESLQVKQRRLGAVQREQQLPPRRVSWHLLAGHAANLPG
ncbi:galactose-proton symporter [Salmonella enterica subsp. enterica]|nr:galactose-proton symporter [Salmonella enterica subsp. enterica] [Salmonella enterica subsp. enterica serovar Menston]